MFYHLKTGNSYDVLGFHIGTDSSNAHKMFEKYQKTLEITLFESAYLPKSNFSCLKEFQDLLKNEEDIILDVTETAIDHDYQGQKKRIVIKKAL